MVVVVVVYDYIYIQRVYECTDILYNTRNILIVGLRGYVAVRKVVRRIYPICMRLQHIAENLDGKKKRNRQSIITKM